MGAGCALVQVLLVLVLGTVSWVQGRDTGAHHLVGTYRPCSTGIYTSGKCVSCGSKKVQSSDDKLL